MSTTQTVDTVTLDGTGISGQLRVVKVLRNGKRRFDPVEKERLIDACLEPGVWSCPQRPDVLRFEIAS